MSDEVKATSKNESRRIKARRVTSSVPPTNELAFVWRNTKMKGGAAWLHTFDTNAAAFTTKKVDPARWRELHAILVPTSMRERVLAASDLPGRFRTTSDPQI